MCGIAGYFGRTPPSDMAARACLGAMHRRGPDGNGIFRHRHGSGQSVLLLHSRLSIIDLNDRANQPFAFGGTVLSFNGEIYNYLELRGALEQRGAGFTTQSDTEVLAQLLSGEGAAALGRCEGMWAFASYDQVSGQLLLSRDRFGEKPLYLYRDADGVYFGSEPKFIFALLGRRLPVNEDQILRYLVNGYKAIYKGRDTFFRGISEVAPGACLTLDPDGGRAVEQRYWHPEIAACDPAMSYADAVAAVRGALIRSVELRLRADVPIAFCLSGGIDSNALIAIAKRHLGYPVHGFTIMNSDERYEERDMVEASVAELGLRHTSVAVSSGDFLPGLATLVAQHDAPVYTITYYAQWRLMQAIHAAGYKVSVSGTGADELFSGYYDHHNAYLAMAQGDEALYAESLANWRRDVEPIVRNPFLRDPEYLVRRPEARDHVFLNAEEFADYLRRPWREAFAEERYCGDLLRNRMANEIFHESVPPILHEDDLNAMYFSIENRSPFLDRTLFEVCQRIPTRHLIRNGRAKSVLREAARGLAPDLVLDNPRKVGFNVPIHDYLDAGDPEIRARLLDNGPIFDLVRRDRIEQLLDRAALPNSESKFLFYFVSAKLFLEQAAL
jgi:asparagine synthase (glutamine-hydrolysing)